MGRTYTLESPFLELEFDGKPDHWRAIVAAWVLFWIAVMLALCYLYTVVFADWVGFETALLVGIFLLIISMEAED